jgi:hypothetical protein
VPPGIIIAILKLATLKPPTLFLQFEVQYCILESISYANSTSASDED